jgi:hypothetical protein
MTHITIKYTCRECGLTEQELDVPERQRAVDVVYWIKMAGSKVGFDHAERQPLCDAKNFDLVIPIAENATMIGRNSE